MSNISSPPPPLPPPSGLQRGRNEDGDWEEARARESTLSVPSPRDFARAFYKATVWSLNDFSFPQELPAIAAYRKSDKFKAHPINNKMAKFK